MKFLDVKTDYAFKKVFASTQNKQLLIEFLNAIIDFPKALKIKNLIIVDPYNIPMLKGMKDSYVDVKAELDNGSKVIIEMQVLNHEGLEQRILYNAAKNYSAQLKKQDDYNLLNPVIAITIVDFIMFKDSDKVSNYFKLLEKDQFIEYSDDIELIFIELPKFKKTIKQLDNIQDQWIYFLQNAGSLETIPKDLTDCVQRALETVNEAGLSEEELEVQHKRKEFIAIQRGARQKSYKEGVEQGIEQGIEQGMIKVARTAKQQGVDIDTIKSLTGLSESDIKKL